MSRRPFSSEDLGMAMSALQIFQSGAEHQIQSASPAMANKILRVIQGIDRKMPAIHALTQVWGQASRLGLIPPTLRTSLLAVRAALRCLGAERELKMVTLQLASGVAFSLASIAQTICAIVAQHSMTKQMEAVISWNREYREALQNARKNVADRVVPIIKFLEKQQEILETPGDPRIFEYESRRTQIRLDLGLLKSALRTYEQLISDCQKQIDQIQEAINNKLAQLERVDRHAKNIMMSGGVLISIAAVTTAVSGGTVPLIVGAAGLAASGSAMITMQINRHARKVLMEARSETKITLSHIQSHKNDCEQFLDELKDLSDTADKRLERDREIAESLEMKDRARFLEEENAHLREQLRLSERQPRPGRVENFRYNTSSTSSRMSRESYLEEENETTQRRRHSPPRRPSASRSAHFWTCRMCTLENGNDSEICLACDTARREDQVSCPICTCVNHVTARRCRACGNSMYR